MIRKLLVVIALGAGALTHQAHRSADTLRRETDVETELLFLPSPTTFEVATLGYHEPVADLLWIRAVLLFGEYHGADPDPAWGDWLAGMLEAISALDPTWRTPYNYGGTMLRSVGALDASDKLFTLGLEALPDDAYFPFALGMNHYLHRGDTETAVHWINVAADKPSAPQWYKVAAAGLLAKQDMIPVAIRFLEDQRASTTDPTLLAMIDERLVKLRHDRLVQLLEEARSAYRARFGRDIETPADLERLGRTLPDDPLGGRWIIGAQGTVVSDVRDAREAERARRLERALLKRR